jgi:hypothetical protein
MTLTCCHRLELSRVVDFEVLFWSVDLSPRAAAVFSVVAVPPPVVGDRLARLLGACACRPLNGLAPFYSIEYVADVGFRRVVFRVKRFLKILKMNGMSDPFSRWLEGPTGHVEARSMPRRLRCDSRRRASVRLVAPPRSSRSVGPQRPL